MDTNQVTERGARLAKLRPGSQTEIYLAIISEQNEELIALLGGATKPQGDEVALREPAPAKAPHRDAKQAAEKVEKEAVGPVTVETVEVVEPDKPKSKRS